MSRKGRSIKTAMDFPKVPHWREQQEASCNALASLARKEIVAKTPGQRLYMEQLDKKLNVICVGPAGTGKSLLAVNQAVKMLRAGQVKKILLSRPLVQCGRGYGFLKGDLEEKIAPFFRPLLDLLHEVMSPVEVEKHRHQKTIELLPLEDMRGTTLKDTFIICDEAQNAEYYQLHMLVTRFGHGSRMVVCGDINRTQIDIFCRGSNPLAEVLRRAEKHPCNAVGIVKLTRDDIVRHGLVQYWDEILGEDSPAQGGHAWYSLRCPECQAKVWYDNGDESSHGHTDEEGVRCWSCEAKISLWDEGDNFSPHLSHLNDNFYCQSYKDRNGNTIQPPAGQGKAEKWVR